MNDKQQKMLDESVEKLVLKLAIPTIITMLITALYNTADTYFIGKTDTNSTAAVGVAFSLMAIIQAVGFFFGHGSGNYMSHKLGSNEPEKAEQMGITGIVCSFIGGLIIMTAGLIFLYPLCDFLGATELLMHSTAEYTAIILIACPFMMTSFTLNNQLRFQGNAFKGMIGMTTGAVINVILDPVFIFAFDMGVSGAAAATAVSQIISFFILLKMRKIRISDIKKVRFTEELISAMISYGTPSLIRQGVGSIAAVCMNNVAGNYSEAVIAAVSVVNRIVMIGNSVIIGFGQGFQPVCGFNLGAKKYSRVIKAFNFCVKTSTIFMLVFGIIVFGFSNSLIKIFRDDPKVIEAGTVILKYQCYTFILQGVVIMTNMLLQNMGCTLKASFLAITRQGLFFIPLIFILNHFLGLKGLEMAQAVSDFLSFLVTLPMAVTAIQGLKRLKESEM